MFSVQLIYLIISCFLFLFWLGCVTTNAVGKVNTHTHTHTHRQWTVRAECASWIIEDGSLTSGPWQRVCVQVWDWGKYYISPCLIVETKAQCFAQSIFYLQQVIKHEHKTYHNSCINPIHTKYDANVSLFEKSMLE